jgi:hypothetical protein
VHTAARFIVISLVRAATQNIKIEDHFQLNSLSQQMIAVTVDLRSDIGANFHPIFIHTAQALAHRFPARLRSAG